MALNLKPKLAIFSGVAILSGILIQVHSENWTSFINALIFIFSDFDYQVDQHPILIKINCVSLGALAIYFFAFKNKWIILSAIILMILYLILPSPIKYVSHPAMNF